jgi:predicted acyltransferase
MSTKQRFLSVDIFRGITIAAMIMVNNPGTWGAIYPPLEHSAWHGITPTDLIFPFFLFIVGMSISFAYSNKKKSKIGKDIYKKIISRSVKLILLGLILAGFTLHFPFFKDLSTLRLPGVLQRIGVVFFFASLIFLHTNWKVLLLIFVAILVAYWAMMTQIPIDGSIPLLTKSSSLASTIDLKILTVDHMWKTTYDPEGILSTLPSIATTIFGILIGLIVLNKEFSHKRKVIYFTVIGLSTLAAGYLWGFSFPLNKTLWTSSYVLASGGWATLVFAVIYYFADIKGHTSWGKPAIVFGSNAITVFFMSGVVARLFGMIKLGNGISIHGNLYGLLTSIISTPKLSSMIYSMFVIGFYYLVALFLFKRNIFIKV